MTAPLLAGGATGLVAVSFQNSVTTGSLVITAILAAGTVVGAIFGVKWKATAQAAAATIELWQDNAAGLKLRADNLQAEKELLIRDASELRATVARLEALPNFQALVTILEHHETAAESRAKRTVEVLERIETQLTKGQP